MILRHSYHLLYITTLLILLPLCSFAQMGKPQDMAPDILKYVNEHRTHMGLKPLAMNTTISAAAQQHSANMASKKIPFGHEGFDGRMDKLAKQLPPSLSFAENVAEGATTARGVVDQWLHSPGHKKNIEGDYNTTGIGIAKAPNGSLYYTQIFLNRGK